MVNIRKTFILSPAENQALSELIKAGYAFPAVSEVAVLRRMLRDAWEKQFPGKSFPDITPEGEKESKR